MLMSSNAKKSGRLFHFKLKYWSNSVVENLFVRYFGDEAVYDFIEQSQAVCFTDSNLEQFCGRWRKYSKSLNIARKWKKQCLPFMNSTRSGSWRHVDIAFGPKMMSNNMRTNVLSNSSILVVVFDCDSTVTYFAGIRTFLPFQL